jgi:tryptophan synthase alpha chain
VKEVTELPVGVGLGVSDGAQAAEVAEFADGVIVGSAFVRCMLDDGPERVTGEATGPDAVRALAQDLAAGVRRVTPGTPAGA